MEANVIKYLEDKYADLKLELSLMQDADPMVKEKIARQLDNTYTTLKYFCQLAGENEEFKEWKHT